MSSQKIQSHKSVLPAVRFQHHHLTSFGGLIVFQALFKKLDLKKKLANCFNHLNCSLAYKSHQIFLLLVIHVLLGFRHLRELAYYADDPMVRRTIGLKRMPNVSTISRSLKLLDNHSYQATKNLSTEIVLRRLACCNFARLTLDFDGSVLWTYSRNTEGTAVGFNPKRRGARGYYPLFATVAQTAQVFDLHHRPGNAHDSQGACEFTEEVFTKIKSHFPKTILEARFDAAHFTEANCLWLNKHGIEFSISVPFQALNHLKDIVEQRQKWHPINHQWSYFELRWKPKRWKKRLRLLFFRQQCLKPRQGPIQLDLFVPQDRFFEFKVVATNKNTSPANVLSFHNGRGSQEGIFGELKSQMQMDYLPARRLLANQMFTLAAIFAHNLNRELQMATFTPCRNTTTTRSARWIFRQANSLRRLIIQKAGYLSKPQGKLTLTLATNNTVASEIKYFLSKLLATA